jgi:hypothetical protein
MLELERRGNYEMAAVPYVYWVRWGSGSPIEPPPGESTKGGGNPAQCCSCFVPILK